MSKNNKINFSYPEPLDSQVAIEPSPGQPLIRGKYQDVLKLTDEFLAQGRHFVASHMLEQLCKQYVNQPQLAIKLLKIYVDHKRLDKGLELAELMLEQFPGHCEALIIVALFYQTANNPDKAIELIKQAVLLEPDDPENHYQLGTMYRSVGEPDLALESFNKALKLKPNRALVLFAISRAEKSRATPAFRKKVQRLTESKKYNTEGQALLHFAMAWLYESIDSERHFKHLRRANKLVSKERVWDCQLSEKRCENNLKTFTRSTLDKLKGCGDREFRPVFIAAMPRSGTTLLEQMLGAHSQLYCVGENAPFENSVISTEFQEGNPLAAMLSAGNPLEDIEKVIAEIAAKHKSNLLVSAAGEQRIVDKSIGNFYMAGLIHLVFPNAKIINIQRHPLDIIYSCYQQFFSTGHNYSYDLKAAAHSYKIYQTEMSHWKSLFPDNIITVRYEELITDNEKVLKSLLAFCELPWEESCLNYREKIGMINTASDGQVRAALHTGAVEKWRRVEGFLQEAINELGEFANYPSYQ